jgi:uncharacterized protein YbbC (DUF1343 family)
MQPPKTISQFQGSSLKVLPALDWLANTITGISSSSNGKQENGLTDSLDETVKSLFSPSKRLGLLSNPTGVTQNGESALDVLKNGGCNIRALFSPEHGPKADREGDIESSSIGSLPVHSLYGATRRPTPEMLEGLDAIVVDLQDVGARFYTYSSTLFHVLEECSKVGIGVIVLDRPNPLGDVVEGPTIEESCFSFIGYAPIPVVHGMTMGELARFFVAWRNLKVELDIVPVQNWSRFQRFDETGLIWRRPSPNLPDYRSASWYVGLCLLEFCNFSVGRGTDAPFQILASPELNTKNFLRKWSGFEDVQISAEEVVPAHAKFANEKCAALRFTSDKGQAPEAIAEFGLTVMATLAASQTNLERTDWDKSSQLIGSHQIVGDLWDNRLEVAINKSRIDAAAFRKTRADFLIYE